MKKQATSASIICLIFILSAGACCAKGALTPLHQAAQKGDCAEIERLIKDGAKVNAEDETGRTPLHYAARAGQDAAVKLLLSFKAKIDQRDKSGGMPLHEAVEFNHLSTVELLIAKGADVKTHSQIARLQASLLPWAVMADSLPIVNLLLEKGLKATEKDKLGRTPLHWARSREVCSTLTSHGAEVNSRTRNQETPLHFAARDRHTEVVEFLITAGAVVDTNDDKGQTPLHMVASNTSKITTSPIPIAELLISHGANVNAKAKNGDTPLDLAVAFREDELGRLLVINGAKH